MSNEKVLQNLIDNPSKPNPTEWAMDAADILSDIGMLSDDVQRHISSIKQHNGAFPQYTDAVVAVLKRALKKVQAQPDSGSKVPEGSESGMQPDEISKSSIFIVHGHDRAMKSEVARVLEQQGLDALILSEQAPNGMTIIEKLEHYARQSAFAVVLYSKDDTTDTGARARQNVVFEHGLFVGCLGRSKVIAMKNGDVEGYSDIAGVEYIHYEDANWAYKLVDALKTAGFDVSRDKVRL